MSTIIGGARHAVPFARQRYRILWINLKTRDQKEVSCESADISQMMEAGEILITDGHEKAPSVYPRNHHREYAMGPMALLTREEKINLTDCY